MSFDPTGIALERLRALILASLGDATGQIDSGVPGLWFFRTHETTPCVRKSAPAMFAAFILEGAKRMRFGELDLLYAPREYLVITGETEYEAQIEQAPYLSVALELPPELVLHTLEALADSGARAGEVPSACVSDLEPELLDPLYRLVQALADPAERTVLAPLIVRELVFRLLRSEWAGVLRQAAQGNSDQQRMREAMTFIQNHCDQRLSVEQLARQVRMSPSHFAHRFRELTRTSPMRYVKLIRLQRARMLIVEGLRVSEAAERVGYQSASHFARDFKSYFGASPGSYARRSQDPARQAQDPALARSSRARRVPA